MGVESDGNELVEVEQVFDLVKMKPFPIEGQVIVTHEGNRLAQIYRLADSPGVKDRLPTLQPVALAGLGFFPVICSPLRVR